MTTIVHDAAPGSAPPYVTMALRSPCPSCGRPVDRSGRRLYCSDACRQAAHRRRRAPAVGLPAAFAPQRPSTVYECPSCDARYVGVQRCDECQLFCRRVEAGGACPHCSEVLTVTELLDVEELPTARS